MDPISCNTCSLLDSPSQMAFSLTSRFLRKNGLVSDILSNPIWPKPSASAYPNSVGIRTFVLLFPRPWSSLVTYERSMIFSICSAIVASVPIPLTSINAISSGSVRGLGADVFPLESCAEVKVTFSPGFTSGILVLDDSHEL
ncbi:hypothetical protein OGAPHI_004091 [Ogataea philodendri]|uniref:Uncharacterized protein n=1 Tax=Ogataea philodendri TaxID=1378263 RepID=A0A9P8P5Z9_9ASCO|nr:uncharacterized protein OGAPHI_004091 [Ogataea philodendri]KAH3665902.1 hypothetical protein OGAPHI_004091 [Ogataea philodendri]